MPTKKRKQRVTSHGTVRLHERVGVTKGVATEASKNADKQGVRPNETKGELRVWVEAKRHGSMDIRIHHNFLYVYGAGKRLVTVYPVPEEFTAELPKYLTEPALNRIINEISNSRKKISASKQNLLALCKAELAKRSAEKAKEVERELEEAGDVEGLERLRKEKDLAKRVNEFSAHAGVRLTIRLLTMIDTTHGTAYYTDNPAPDEFIPLRTWFEQEGVEIKFQRVQERGGKLILPPDLSKMTPEERYEYALKAREQEIQRSFNKLAMKKAMPTHAVQVTLETMTKGEIVISKPIPENRQEDVEDWCRRVNIKPDFRLRQLSLKARA